MQFPSDDASSDSADEQHWSYVSILDIPHYDELFARKHRALNRALADPSPNPHGGSEELELSRLFTFLSGIPPHTLDRVARKFSLSTDAGITKLEYIIYKYLCDERKRGRNIYTALIANEYCPLFDDFLEHVLRTGEALQKPPTEEQTDAVLGAQVTQEDCDDLYLLRAEPHQEKECIGQEFFDQCELVDSTPLSLPEFTRLVLILCKDQLASNAMQKLAMDTSKDQGNQNKYREAFWRLVALRYNDPNVHLSFPFTGGVRAANAVTSKSQHNLKAHFQVALGRFMTYFGNWHRFSNGERDKFEKLLYKRDTELCTCSRRALAMFQAGMSGNDKGNMKILRRWTQSVFFSFEEGIPVSSNIEDY